MPRNFGNTFAFLSSFGKVIFFCPRKGFIFLVLFCSAYQNTELVLTRRSNSERKLIHLQNLWSQLPLFAGIFSKEEQGSQSSASTLFLSSRFCSIWLIVGVHQKSDTPFSRHHARENKIILFPLRSPSVLWPAYTLINNYVHTWFRFWTLQQVQSVTKYQSNKTGK